MDVSLDFDSNASALACSADETIVIAVARGMDMDRSDPVVQRLLESAKAAAARAYAPYSGFPVGAAVLTESGEVFAGCNVENSSYSLTVCAERNAMFQAVARGHRRMVAVAIFVPEGNPAPPCGACRQVMSELAPEARVLSFSGDGNRQEWSVAELQPQPFLLDRGSWQSEMG